MLTLNSAISKMRKRKCSYNVLKALFMEILNKVLDS